MVRYFSPVKLHGIPQGRDKVTFDAKIRYRYGFHNLFKLTLVCRIVETTFSLCIKSEKCFYVRETLFEVSVPRLGSR